MVKDGIVTSLDPRTGALHKRDRLGTEKMKVYASPVAGDGKVYFAGTEGQVAVVKAGPQWEVLGTNDLDEGIYASPAIVEGHIYVRTRSRLYSFSERAPGRAADATATR
jgi:outer membrane protein assembly factor BamB